MTEAELREMSRRNGFEHADYYALPTAERYHCKSVEEFIRDHVDDNNGGDESEEATRALGLVTVAAFQRLALDPKLASRAAADLIERAGEAFDEEHGDPDDSTDFSAFTPKMEALLAEMFGSAKVWTCEKVGERTFSVEEIVAVMHPPVKVADAHE
jgi:hypothetical protein